MGLFFTLLFVLTAYLNPETVFGALVQYHMELIIGAFTAISSLFSASGSGASKIPQTYALIGLIGTVGLSLLFAGWLGGIPLGLLDFVPNAMVFFFVIWNVKTRRHLQILIFVLLFCAVLIVFWGIRAEFSGAANSGINPYVLTMRNDAGEAFFRIRGTSFLHDPNDLAQYLIALLPMLFIFWTKGSVLLNLFLVYLPSAFLLYGVFLTHSRGAMVALMVAAIVAFRRKIGILPSLIGGVIFFAGLLAAGFSGGRDVGASAGDDRVATWSMALTLIKTHPIFGIGYRRFTEYNPLPAHNTILMCASELGLIGLVCWLVFVVTTVLDIVHVNSVPTESLDAVGPARAPGSFPLPASPAYQRAELASASGSGLPLNAVSLQNVYSPAQRRGISMPGLHHLGISQDANTQSDEQNELRRIARLLVISWSGFLTAAWFLPRAYAMTVFVNVGISVVLFRLVREQGIAVQPMKFGRAVKAAVITSLVTLIFLYASVRLDHLIPK